MARGSSPRFRAAGLAALLIESSHLVFPARTKQRRKGHDVRPHAGTVIEPPSQSFPEMPSKQIRNLRGSKSDAERMQNLHLDEMSQAAFIELEGIKLITLT